MALPGNPQTPGMNILIIGSGGREHTLAWKISQSNLCRHLLIAPGNAGTSALGTNLAIAVTDFDALAKAIREHRVNLLIVGPEEPLVKGITDYFRGKAGFEDLKIIGPSAEAAQLEGSKSFAKAFMQRNGIPTAGYREFTAENYEEGVAYIRNHPLPIVLKADGLAAGKGVLICHHHIEALAEFELMIMRAKFGEAGKKVVVEQFLEGIEMSVFALTNGNEYVLLPEAKDYKRVGVGDTGLNTGGMGAVSPVPLYDEELKRKVIERIVEPTVKGIREEGMDYTGFVFFGLMISGGEPYVIEYNCRMGDPETEVVVPRLQNDLIELLLAACEGRLAGMKLSFDLRTAVTVVAVSGGYPGEYRKGLPVSGLDQAPLDDCILFHAGTILSADGSEVLTNGGRVLAATAFGDDVRDAVELASYMLEQLHFEDMYFRPDIGYEFRESDKAPEA
ncbi:MAG TPA: phosphoribosylamine--glycine ligase [Ferruginibacter sp.]|nr:phosphoribosylamine--glycine ligase [Ferruginibacter sp.]